MEYDVMVNSDCAELVKRVQWCLDRGWKLQGGVAISYRPSRDEKGYDESFVWFAQAVVREKEDGK